VKADTTSVRAFFETDAYLTLNPILPIRARLVGELLSDLHGGQVLDLGSGDGSVSRPLLAAGNDVTLVDFSQAMLHQARQAAPPPSGGRVQYVEADVLEWETDTLYDVVLCIGVLAHVNSSDRLLERVARATRLGGRCILQITDAGCPLGWLLTRYARLRQREGYRLNELTRQQLLALAANHGLVPIAARRYGLFLPGTGRLPYRWQSWLEGHAASGWLSHVAAGRLVMFQRET
jgi:ubiquinone/menaquinone biosynthesis C-methylase UbiE